MPMKYTIGGVDRFSDMNVTISIPGVGINSWTACNYYSDYCTPYIPADIINPKLDIVTTNKGRVTVEVWKVES